MKENILMSLIIGLTVGIIAIIMGIINRASIYMTLTTSGVVFFLSFILNFLACSLSGFRDSRDKQETHK